MEIDMNKKQDEVGMNKIKILIIDDHAILRMGLSSLLNSRRDFKVVGEAGDGESGIAKAMEIKPDVVIVDLMMPGMDGCETTRRLIAQNGAAKILILTTFGTADGISYAIDAGAKGAIMKSCDFDELLTAIRNIAAGRKYISPELERIISSDPPVMPLSQRQKEILRAIAQGLSNSDIATQLDISVNMVKEHVETLFRKIGAANRPEAIAIALRKHLLKPD